MSIFRTLAAVAFATILWGTSAPCSMAAPPQPGKRHAFAIGDEAFFGAIKEFVRRYQWQSATWENLLGVFAEVGGADLGWVADEYIDRTGAPFIELAGAESETVDPDGSPIRGWRNRPFNCCSTSILNRPCTPTCERPSVCKTSPPCGI